MYCVDMFKWPFPFHINRRLEALESTPIPAEFGAQLAIAQEEILAVRAAQDAADDVLGELERKYHEIVLAVGEGIERVERDERRIRAAVQRARQKLKDGEIYDEGLEAEADGLRLADGNGVEPVPAVSDFVAEPTAMAQLVENLRQRGLSR